MEDAAAPKLDRVDVLKVASLARLRLSDQDVDAVAPQLTRILDYIRMLDEVDTTDVEPMAHAVEQHNVFRADAPSPSLPVEDALTNAPRQDGRYFLVPPILDAS